MVRSIKGEKYRGKQVYQFKNGARAIKKPNGQYRIIAGADPKYMKKIRKSKRGRSKRSISKKKQLVRLKSAHKLAHGKNWKQSLALDLALAGKIPKKTSTWRRGDGPTKYDLSKKSIDYGPIRRKPSKKQLAALRKGRNSRKRRTRRRSTKRRTRRRSSKGRKRSVKRRSSKGRKRSVKRRSSKRKSKRSVKRRTKRKSKRSVKRRTKRKSKKRSTRRKRR